ncbi:hypothetical protein AX769_18035 [Frondihabitans sp. PAMC 28766]|uniref:glycosyltransferase n=1 Tax=Frondihabitans sp. PAMC 28766 TaxID=1795630 RepID=UPI00078DDDC3|nr:glycosyltransferase family 2 protein [Frondihabitans sp. PAMC 28766]AMM21700.1 hypothetical protein AX769_18035 [Frondihabitans sp. PAMC 28766]
MRASVIVVDWHQPELTRRCVAALMKQQTASGFDVVVVENEVAPGAAPDFSDLGAVTVVEVRENSGFAGGVDRGIRESDAPVVVLVNNDAVVEPGFLQAGIQALQGAGGDVAAVAGAVILEGQFVPAVDRDSDTLVGLDGRLWRRVRDGETGRALLNGTGVELTRDGNGFDRDWLAPVEGDLASHDLSRPDPFGFSGGAVFIRRGALEAVGGFDPALFMYYEDVDVAWRLRLAGYRIALAADAVVVHRHAASSSSNGTLVRSQSMTNRLAVVVRNGSPSMIARVAARTALRLVADFVRPRNAYIDRPSWGRVLGRLPGLVRHSLSARRRDGVASSRRREVERLLL